MTQKISHSFLGTCIQGKVGVDRCLGLNECVTLYRKFLVDLKVFEERTTRPLADVTPALSSARNFSDTQSTCRHSRCARIDKASQGSS